MACKKKSPPAAPVEVRNEYNGTVHYYNEDHNIVIEDTIYQSLVTTIEKQDTMTVIVMNPSGQLHYSELQVKRIDTTSITNYYAWYNSYSGYNIQLTVDPLAHKIHFSWKFNSYSPSNSNRSYYEVEGL
jgi:hypothetical protein